MLDSPGFDPEQHIAALIASYPIDRLLAEHRGMAREIKNLDSDMQQLVYENYNKFITATDTIRAMKANVDGMEADMAALARNMDSVAERSSAVNAKLLKRRQHIEELHRVQSLLGKLQAVFDLPARMKAALEEDALDSAVSFYAEALPLLRKFGHRGAFRGVSAEADAAARDVGAALKRRLAERKDDTEQVVLLLRKLGEDNDSLQERYVQGRRERMQRILLEGGAVADAMAAASRSPGAAAGAAAGAGAGSAALAGVESPAAWGFGASGAVPSLARFVRALDEKLLNAMQETAVNVASIFLQSDQGAARRKPLVGMAKEVMGAYFQLVRRAVGDAAMAAVATAACLHLAGGDRDFAATSPSLTFGDSWGADTLVQALSTVSTDVGLLHGSLPELSLRDWAAAATEQAVRGHVAAAFGALAERLASGVAMLSRALAAPGAEQAAQLQPLSPAYHYLAEVVQRGTAALLKDLRTYEQHGRLLGSLGEALPDLVQAQLATLFQGCLSGFLRAAAIKDAGLAGRASSEGAAVRPPGGGGGDSSSERAGAGEPPRTGLVLLLARLCLHMEGATVPAVMEALASGFQPRSGFRGSDEPPPFVGGEVARRLGTAANLLLSSWVELHGRSLSLLLQRSVAATNWLQAQPPQAPRPVCDLLLERLARAEAEVARLVDDAGRSAGSGFGTAAAHQQQHHRGGSVGEALLESGAVERGVAKLFRGKVQPFGAGGVRFSQSALLAAVVIAGLKSLLEYVRLQTLGKAGLQQLQLEVAYLRPRLLGPLGGQDAEAVAQLADEVVAAGAGRCLEPVLLEPALLDKMLRAAREQQA